MPLAFFICIICDGRVRIDESYSTHSCLLFLAGNTHTHTHTHTHSLAHSRARSGRSGSMLHYAASFCCNGGISGVNPVCGTPFSTCQDPSHFTPDMVVFRDTDKYPPEDVTCMQLTMGLYSLGSNASMVRSPGPRALTRALLVFPSALAELPGQTNSALRTLCLCASVQRRCNRIW